MSGFVKDMNVPTNDLISRQAAIDAIPQRIKGLGGESWMMTYRRSGYNDCVDACLDTLRHLPSAQPEIIYCGECKYMMPNGRCSVFADSSIRPSASDYCSSAERKQI